MNFTLSTGIDIFGRLACILALASMASCGGSADSPPEVPAAKTAKAVAMSLSVSTGVQALTIHPGDANVPLDVSVGASTYAGPVVVTLANLPSGISVAPITLVGGESGTLYLNASSAADQEQFPTTSQDTEHDTTVTVVAAAGSLQATSPVTLTTSIENASYAPDAASINLPVVTINTNGVAIADKTTDVPGTITITSADGATSYLPSVSGGDNTATFHLHGNSTAAMPKKPYHLKLGTSVDLLGAMGMKCPYATSSGKAICDKSKSYILLANYDDKTLLRDWSASALANMIPMGGSFLSPAANAPSPSGTSAPMPWAPHSLFVELTLNGVYQGNYQLMEEVKVDSHRVNISELSETDTTGDLTGGYLMEIDAHVDEAYVFHTPSGLPIGLIDPDFSPDPEISAQTSYINTYVDAADSALFGPDFADPALGWRAYFDETSAVNFYIVNDLLGNVDGGAFFSSDYLYKDKGNPLLFMGPIWDFDISSGNVDYQGVVDPTFPWMQNTGWYARWFQDPAFKADVARQWNALKANGVLANWTAMINAQAAALQQSQANNNKRWPMQGMIVWPNAVASGSYDSEVAYLQNWVALRTGYLDALFNAKAASQTVLAAPSASLMAGTKTTLSAQVTAGGSATGSVFFLANGVVIGSAPVDASGNAQLVTAALWAGDTVLKAVYAGDATYALSSSPVVSTTVAPALVATTVSIANLQPSTAGSAANISVAVIAASGTTSPTGTIQLTSNGVVVGSGTLSAGTVVIAVSSTTGALQATYGGDAVCQGSTSNTLGSAPQVLRAGRAATSS